MNLRDLDYIVAVADCRHFGKASLQCHVSQPTLSMQIRKVEERLGVQIFERGRKQVLLTPLGERLVAEARETLQAAQRIEDLARQAKDPLTGDFRLGLFPTLAPYLLPKAMKQLQHSLPRLTLLLIEEKTDHLLEQLATGKLDAALLALPLDEESGFETLSLFDDPFYLAVPVGHPLAKRKSITVQDMEGEEVLLLEEGHCMRAQALALCSLSVSQERRSFRATSLETLRHMVASGVGVTLIPRLAQRAHDGLVYIPFREKRILRHIGLVWRKGTRRAAVREKLASVFKRSAGKD